jgi:probable F420-dependent oxidoreductase
VHLGLAYVNWASPDRPGEFARRAEALGFESLWTTEHVVVPAGYESWYPYSRRGRMAGGLEDFPSPDPLVWLSAAAATTSEIRLATGVLVLPQRNPLILAKEAATLDVISGGRVTLGVGSGWLEEEFDALGVEFAGRGDRTDEYIAVMRTLWTEELASFEGETVAFSNVYMRPQPVQRPIPIVIGGHSKRAARRAGELGDGFFPFTVEPEKVPGLVAQAREHAERSGRDPDELEISLGSRSTPEFLEMLRSSGTARAVLRSPQSIDGLDELADAVGEFLP